MNYLLCGPLALEAHSVLSLYSGPTCSFLVVPKATDSARALHRENGGRVFYCDSYNGAKRFQEDLPWCASGDKSWSRPTWDEAWLEMPSKKRRRKQHAYS